MLRPKVVGNKNTRSFCSIHISENIFLSILFRIPVKIPDLKNRVSIKVPRIQGDTYIDMGANNGGSCSASGGGGGSGSGSATTTFRPEPAATTPAWTSASVVDCSVKDGLFPDPANCRGFIKCAQVLIVMRCYCLLRPGHCVRATPIPRSAEEVSTLTRSPTTATGPQPPTVMADPCDFSGEQGQANKSINKAIHKSFLMLNCCAVYSTPVKLVFPVGNLNI